MTGTLFRVGFAALFFAAGAAIPTAMAQTGNGQNAMSYHPESMVRSSELHRSVRIALQDAEKAMAARQWSEAVAAIRKAQESASGNYDKLKIYQALTILNQNLQNTEDADTAAEAAADLPTNIPAEDRKDVYASAAALAFDVGHKDKAVQYARKLEALHPTDEDSRHIIARILSPDSGK